MAAVTGHDVRKALVLHAIWTANIRHAKNPPIRLGEYRPGAAPESELLPISVLALASALHMPYESMRRHTEALRRNGLCAEREAGGFKINTAVLDGSVRRPNILMSHWTSLREMIGELHELGYDFPATEPRDTEADRWAIVRACSEFVMRITEYMTEANNSDYLAGFLHSALYVANLRESFRMALAARGGRATPYPHFRPISVRSLAQRVGLPFETVRRYCARMRDRGEIIQERRGLILAHDLSEDGKCAVQMRRICTELNRLISDLHRAGMSFEQGRRAP